MARTPAPGILSEAVSAVVFHSGKFMFFVLFKVVGRVRAFGRENIPRGGGLIIASNHQSNFDPPLVGTLCPRRTYFLAKKELFKNPAIGALLKHCGAFPVERGRMDREALRTAIDLLRGGKVLIMFPEGTRSKTGELGKGEAGAITIAQKANVPVVPAALSGTMHFLEKGGPAPGFPQLSIRYGAPMFDWKDRKLSKEEIQGYTDVLMEKIGEMHKDITTR